MNCSWTNVRLRHFNYVPHYDYCMLDKLTSDSFHIPIPRFFKVEFYRLLRLAFYMKIMVKTLLLEYSLLLLENRTKREGSK